MQIITVVRDGLYDMHINEQEQLIVSYCSENKLQVDRSYIVPSLATHQELENFYAEVFKVLVAEDTVITTSLGCFGKSGIGAVKNVISLMTTGVSIIAIREGFSWSRQQNHHKEVNKTFETVEQLLTHFNTERAISGFMARKEKGGVLGRTKGSTSSKFDKHADYIKKRLQDGAKVTAIAKELGENPQALYPWIKSRRLKSVGKSKRRPNDE